MHLIVETQQLLAVDIIDFVLRRFLCTTAQVNATTTTARTLILSLIFLPEIELRTVFSSSSDDESVSSIIACNDA